MHRQPHLKKRVTFLKKQENAEGKQEELPDILPEYQAIYQENPEFARLADNTGQHCRLSGDEAEERYRLLSGPYV